MAKVSVNLDSNDVPLKIESQDLDVDVNQMSAVSVNVEAKVVPSKTEPQDLDVAVNKMSAVSVNVESKVVPLKSEAQVLDVAVNQMSNITAKPKSPDINTEDSDATESAHEGKDDIIDNSQPLFDEIDDCTPNVGVNDVGAVMEDPQEKDDSKCNVNSLNDNKNSTTEVDIENITENEVSAKENEMPSTQSDVKIHLEKLSPKLSLKEVKDSSHDLTWTSTSSDADNSNDSSFSKFKF